MARRILPRIPHLGALAFAASCAATADTPKVDAAAEQQALLATDRAWAAQASGGTNVDSVVAYWTEDGRVIQAGQPTVSGKAAIRQMVTSMYATKGFHVNWSPEKAVVSASGDLGYTTGTSEFITPDATGKKTVTTVGRYVEVWRKEADGKWHCVEDFGTPGTGAPPAAPAAAK